MIDLPAKPVARAKVAQVLKNILMCREAEAQLIQKKD